MRAYLDYAAATPMAPEAVRARLPYLSERYYNPSAPYAAAREVHAELEDARAALARTIGARPANVVLTAGATEANNLAFAATSGRVVTDAIEHESVLACAAARHGDASGAASDGRPAFGNRPASVVSVARDGRVDAADVAAALTPDTELVSVALANGEIGTLQPVREISRVVAAERRRRLEARRREAERAETSPRRVGSRAGSLPIGLRRLAVAGAVALVLALLVSLGIVVSGLADAPGRTTTATVRAGQSLWEVAAATGTGDVEGAMARIVELNALESSVLEPGQVLVVPAG